MSESMFLGRWKLVSNYGLYDFMDAVGLKLPRDNNLVMFWKQNPNGYLVHGLEVTGRISTRLFKLGEPQEYVNSDGRKINLTISQKGNVLNETRVYDGKLKVVVVRKFTGNKMEANATCEGIESASGQFEKE